MLIDKNEIVTCRKCGKSGKYDLHESPFPFVPYYDYRKGSDYFYLCKDCSGKWLHQESNIQTSKGKINFIKFVEPDTWQQYVCPHCGRLYD